MVKNGYIGKGPQSFPGPAKETAPKMEVGVVLAL